MGGSSSSAVRDRYRILGPVYDALCSAYSFGGIRRSKLVFLSKLARPGLRVLVPGAGHGDDVLAALRAGAEVTVVERSASMLGRLQRRLARLEDSQRKRCQWVHSDLFDTSLEPHDVVLVHYFLNVFPRARVPQVLDRLRDGLRPGGVMLVADFAEPRGNLVHRAVQHVYWTLAVLPFWVLAGNALHTLYDVPLLARSAGFSCERRAQFTAGLLGSWVMRPVPFDQVDPAVSPED